MLEQTYLKEEHLKGFDSYKVKPMKGKGEWEGHQIKYNDFGDNLENSSQLEMITKLTHRIKNVACVNELITIMNRKLR